MTFLPEAFYEGLGPVPQAACDRQFAEWSTLRDAVVPFIGEHAATLFSHAICDENDALVASVYLRKALIDTGENPDNPTVTEAEQSLIDWGRLIARDPARVPAGIQEQIESTFSEQLRVLLAAFAAQTVSVTVFEEVLAIQLDSKLYEFRKPGDSRTHS